VPAVLRIIVGASGSPGSLRALRYAQHLARDYDATLVPVLAWLPPCGDLADRRTPNQELRHLWAQDAHQKLEETLNLAWGTPPTGLPVQPLIRHGKPGPVLADAACRPGDLLLVGAGRRGAVARTGGGRVSRYCLAHAPCPVLALPPTRPRPARLGIPPPRARPPDQPGVVGLTGQGHRTRLPDKPTATRTPKIERTL
jgi:nucleotide-binding universal stress UspA family protein